MKKLIVFLFLCMSAGLLCAKNWTNCAGAGISLSYFSLNPDGDETKSVFEPQGNLSYFGVHKNGFCLSGNLNIGVPFSSDFVLSDGDDKAFGFGMGLSLGAGYAFINNEKLTLAVLGSLGLDWLRFTFKKEITAKTSDASYTAEWTQTDNVLIFGVGAEIFAKYNLTNRFALFADCNLRYPDAGRIWIEGKNVSKEYDSFEDVRGYITVEPAFGVIWTF